MRANTAFWLKHQTDLERWAAEGLTGRQIADRLGTSRSAVLGRAHRTGVILPVTGEKRKRVMDAAQDAAKRWNRSEQGRAFQRAQSAKRMADPAFAAKFRAASVKAQLARWAAYRKSLGLLPEEREAYDELRRMGIRAAEAAAVVIRRRSQAA